MSTGKCHWRRAYPGPLTGTTQKLGQTAEKASFFLWKKNFHFFLLRPSLNFVYNKIGANPLSDISVEETFEKMTQIVDFFRRQTVYAKKTRYFFCDKIFVWQLFLLLSLFVCLFYLGLGFLQPLFHLDHNHLVSFYDYSLHLLNLYIALRIEWKKSKKWIVCLSK